MQSSVVPSRLSAPQTALRPPMCVFLFRPIYPWSQKRVSSKFLKWLHTLTMFDNVWSCSNDCILWQCLTMFEVAQMIAYFDNVWHTMFEVTQMIAYFDNFLQCLKLLKWLHTLATTFSWPQEREEVLLYQKELEMECFLWSLIDRHSKCSFFRFHYKWKFTYSSGNTQYCVRKYLLRFMH